MALLNCSILKSLPVKSGATARNPLPPCGILQIGDGNFLRAFADWMIDIANDAEVFNGRVTMVQPLAAGIAALMAAQDNLYTVLLRGFQGGQAVEETRVINCIEQVINPHEDWHAVRAAAADPTLRFVISNTTEAGIAYADEAYIPGHCQKSFPAKVTALLYERFQCLGGEGGLVFLPCELIEANGTRLREYVLQYADRWQLPEAFAAWVIEQNIFCNTLVDRIVPGHPAAETGELFARWGYEDRLAVAAEPFHVWVIEGPAGIADEFPLHKAGLNVVWTDDLQPYRTRKVRILNGAHTACSLAAFCAGLDTVKDMTDDPQIADFLRAVMYEEIVPFVSLPDEDRLEYADTIMERFSNPHIRHELISIALNSVSKWQVRVLPTVRDYLRQHGSAPRHLAFSLAALLHFYHGTRQPDGSFQGLRGNGVYSIRDNLEIISVIEAAWQASVDPATVAGSLLGNPGLWGEDLAVLGDLRSQVARALEKIETDGVRAAMAAI